MLQNDQISKMQEIMPRKSPPAFENAAVSLKFNPAYKGHALYLAF